MAQHASSVRLVVVALVRQGYRYLMVRDDNRGGAWYPPAGAVERGEDLAEAATRVVMRACGCTPVLQGIVQITHMPLMPGDDTGRLRFVIDGQLSADALTEKTALSPATYLLPAEIHKLDLREDSIATLIDAHARGKTTAPFDLYRVGLV